MAIAHVGQFGRHPNEKDPPTNSPRVHAWNPPKRLTSKGKFGSGGTLPSLFTEDYIYRPHLTNRFVEGIVFIKVN